MLPATLTIYAGTIAAIEHENYGAVRALTVDATVDWSLFTNRKVAVLDKAGPWEIVGHERHLGLALRAAQTGVLTEQLLDALAAGRLPRRPVYPVSAFCGRTFPTTPIPSTSGCSMPASYFLPL